MRFWVGITDHDWYRFLAARPELPEVRATHGRRLKLPDALVVATAMHLKADRILTTDRRWPKLPVEVVVAR